MKKERIAYLDYLRVFAIIAVIVLHVAADNWHGIDVRKLEWNVLNFYDSMVRWGVPVFLMISGSLFLSREIKTKTLYSRYISRLVVAYGVWSLLYALEAAYDRLGSMGFGAIVYRIFFDTIFGKSHMWFIPMIIGIYMCIPIIRKIVESKEVTKYFLVLSLIFACIIPQIVNISADFAGALPADIISAVNDVISTADMRMVMGFAFFFVLGYWLDGIELTKKHRAIVYALGVAGFLATVLLSAAAAWKTQIPSETYYDEFAVNVVMEAVAVHTWFKYRDYENEKRNAIIAQLSKYSFGAYLVHIGVIEVLKRVGLHTGVFSALLSVPVLSVVVVLISFTISFVLNRIPVLKKWIV